MSGSCTRHRRRLGLATGLLACMLGAPASRARAQERGGDISPLHSGGWVIGGSASLSSSHAGSSDGRTTSIGVQPTGLLFVTPRLAVGATASMSYSGSSAINGYAIGIGPAARYYFFPDSAQRWLPFVGASYTPRWIHTHFKNGGIGGQVNSSASSWATDESIGLTRIVAAHVGITGEVYGTQSAFTTRPIGTSITTRSDEFGLRFGITVFVH